MEIKVPEFGESITEGTVVGWMVQEGDHVQRGDALVEIETDKVNMEIPSDGDGVVQQILKQAGDNVLIGEVIAILGEAGSAPAPAAEKASTEDAGGTAEMDQPSSSDAGQAATAKPEVRGTLVPPAKPDALSTASPSARKQAREQGVSSQPSAPTPPTPAPVSSAVSASGEASTAKPVERVRMSRRRQTIAKRLVEAQQTAAMLTTFNEVDMTAVMDVRARRKDAFFEKHGVKLGFMSFFTKAVIGALKDFPLLNAEIEDNDVILKKFYDIGVAVSTEEGLVVPTVREADRLSFAELEGEIGELAKKARDNQLTLSDLQGGTFTITNGGVFGSLLSTPILNPPQVGILGMHKIQVRPVTVGDSMENRPMMYIALSYDHRIVDGKEAVGFLVRVKELLEDPESLWFDV